MAIRNKPSRILVFRGGALGDFLLTLPAIAALRRRFPGAHIELAGYEKNAGLALITGLIDRLQSLDSARMALYFQSECALPPEEKEYIRSFDLIVSYLHDPDGVLLKHLKDAGAKKVITVSPMVKKGHASDHFFSGLKGVLGNEKCAPAKLEWPESLRKEAHRRLSAEIGKKQAIIIHPGSGSPAKNWPAEKFARLAKKIRNETGFEPIIIGGEADISAIAVMRPLLPGFNIYENLSLPDVASILSVAGGFVGNDSGITHLAAALGVPVVALFGPTDPEIWAPRGKNVFIIESVAKVGPEPTPPQEGNFHAKGRSACGGKKLKHKCLCSPPWRGTRSGGWVRCRQKKTFASNSIKSRLPSNESLSGIGVEDVFSALKKKANIP